MITARRPTTRPSASIRCHFFSTSAGLIDRVTLLSAFMAGQSSLELSRYAALAETPDLREKRALWSIAAGKSSEWRGFAER